MTTLHPPAKQVIDPSSAKAAQRPADASSTIAANSIFQTLVRERTSFGWILTILMLVVYFGFIGLIAFDKQLLATKVSGTASLGLFMGVGVIVFAFILTGIYVARANTRFDRLSAELARSLAR
ncbi:DUF485 domain-containing protein [Methylobacterium brachythecii]|uniref:Uncharacterized membrane protein (DUF485 family) n=1 Tax=Methylobacterium brachythecii TaxID=1176177 RepID=A0A7W6F804_9HYPH|nr:DUF485 domain-containing protein [Methylobacterium brachythecii]MBB3903681.1 uncharacterized membrane protein (DUF485 family) [Methylobacterium brachythecii]GLS44251.1 hypothetical protein GCM10007884_22390 [Methylobacterium brachythecii]